MEASSLVEAAVAGASAELPVKRQAVVIIHGIGEQRPMDTLRSFATGIKAYLTATDTTEKNSVLRSKPDRISDGYETRMISLSGTHNRPITDFYEFYWAHNMRDTAFKHTFTWMRKLVFTSPFSIPKRLINLWATVWGLVLGIVLTFVLLLYFLGLQEIKLVLAAIVAFPLALTILTAIQNMASDTFITTAGDAARYFTPVPDNIEQRNKIRQQGIAFLKKLHDPNADRKYDRVILVAHSLGTAIAYDLLRLLWTEYNASYLKNSIVQQDHIKEMDQQCKTVKTVLDDKETTDFQNLQYNLWKQQRSTGNKWLITDFVTLGAAICNLDYFLVSRIPFKQFVTDREFPICPPILDDRKKSISFETMDYDIQDKGQTVRRSVRLLHDAALFAITRWTNIYFTGDFVGGDMSHLFGNGVKNIPIDKKSWWFLPAGHTKYWDEDSKQSLKSIKEAMHLRYDENP